MKIFEAPAPKGNTDDVCVFLGGGITGCPDWQSEMINLLGCCLTPRASNITRLYNPRRATFDITDPTQSKIQIDWEFEHLMASDIILFWFPAESVCPITLFELGKWSMTHRDIYVGCHPDYPRRFDVEYQLKLESADWEVATSLHELADQVVDGIYRKINQPLYRPLEPLSHA